MKLHSPTMCNSLESLRFIDLLKRDETCKALKLLNSDKFHLSGKTLVMKDGKPVAVPVQELANLLCLQ